MDLVTRQVVEWSKPLGGPRRLVRESHTTNVPVTVWSTNDSPTKAGAS